MLVRKDFRQYSGPDWRVQHPLHYRIYLIHKRYATTGIHRYCACDWPLHRCGPENDVAVKYEKLESGQAGFSAYIDAMYNIYAAMVFNNK